MSVKSSMQPSSSSSQHYSSNKALDLKCDAIKEKRKAACRKSSSTTKSSWTPLGSNTKLNEKLFLERKDLVCNWFEKWNETQRREILLSILDKCTVSQKVYIDSLVHPVIPVHKADFSRILPRSVILYIFSFLDPRSLCRCARVSWYLKHLSEADECWMPKCIKLDWWPSFQISQYEKGIWKRLFVESIIDLRSGRVPKGNLKFEAMESESEKSSHDEHGLQTDKAEKKRNKSWVEKHKKNIPERKPKIKQLYPLRSSSLHEQDHIRRKPKSMQLLKNKRIGTDNEDTDNDQAEEVSIEQNELKNEENDKRPAWLTHRNKDLIFDVNMSKASHLFLQNIADDSDEIQDQAKERTEVSSAFNVFSPRPWVLPQHKGISDDETEA